MDLSYTVNDLGLISFFQVPKAIFAKEDVGNDKYKGLSLGAKMTYGILLDRLNLSRKNGWMDNQGRIYFMYSEDDLAEILETTPKTARKYKKELQNYGLLWEKRQGQGKPNLMYLNKPVQHEIQTGKNDRSEPVKITGQDRSKLPGNNTDINNTDRINDYDYITIIEEIWELHKDQIDRSAFDVVVARAKNGCKNTKAFRNYLEKAVLVEIQNIGKRKNISDKRQQRKSRKSNIPVVQTASTKKLTDEEMEAIINKAMSWENQINVV